MEKIYSNSPGLAIMKRSPYYQNYVNDFILNNNKIRETNNSATVVVESKRQLRPRFYV